MSNSYWDTEPCWREGRYDVDRVLQDIRDAAQWDPFIHKIVLFGSRARGDNTGDSDYDLAIYADPGGMRLLF